MKGSTSDLTDATRAVIYERSLGEDFTVGGVGAAIRTAEGNIYTGVCIDLGCGLGFCAEVAAIAQRVTNKETHIESVVAVNRHGKLPPYGRCREAMAQIDARNLECKVIIGENSEATLRKLLPDLWLTGRKNTGQPT